MLLVVGLGNPGSEYERQRHNVGFMAVNVIHRRHGFGPWRRRFKGEIAEGTLGGEKALLLKPLTYMNDSGRAVQEAAHFYKLTPNDIVVIHDEVDLPPAKVRLKAGGGSAGHNGLRSITAAIGDDYRRIRIGVGHPGREAMLHYVLHEFAKADTEWLVPLLDAIADNAPLLADHKDATFANRVHAALAPAKPEKDSGKPSPEKGSGKKKAVEKMLSTPSSGKDEAPPPADSRRPAQDPPAEGPLARGLRKLFGG